KFGGSQLHKNDAKDKKDSRVLRKTLRLVDPKLGDRSGQNQQSNKKILRRFRLFATKDEKCETAGKHRKDQHLDIGEFSTLCMSSLRARRRRVFREARPRLMSRPRFRKSNILFFTCATPARASGAAGTRR